MDEVEAEANVAGDEGVWRVVHEPHLTRNLEHPQAIGQAWVRQPPDLSPWARPSSSPK